MSGFVGYIVTCSCGARPATASGWPAITWRCIDGKWYCGACAQIQKDGPA